MKLPGAEGLDALAEKILPLLQKYRAVLIVLLAGIMLLAAGGRSHKDTAISATEQQANAAANESDLSAFEEKLQEELVGIAGVGRVSLMLSLEETSEAVYAVNVRQTRGESSSQSYESDLTVISDSDRGQSPVAVKHLQPVFRGAVVLCDGADDDSVRFAVTQAVSTVCGIGSDRVTVLKMADDA